MRNSKWKRARSDAGEGSDNYKSNGRAEMKSAKKGKKQGRARHLDGPFAHFTISKIGGVDYGMDFNTGPLFSGKMSTKWHLMIAKCWKA